MAKAGDRKKHGKHGAANAAPGGVESPVVAATSADNAPPMNFKTVFARVAAIALMVALLALLVTVCRTAYAEYAYRTMPAPAPEAPRATQQAYADHLYGLLKVDPSNSEIRSRLANLESALGNKQQAIDQLKQAMLTQRTQNSLYFLAQMHEQMKNPAEAEQVLADAVLINPSNIEINQALLRMINSRVAGYEILMSKGQTVDQRIVAQGRADFERAAVNWSVRAYYDPNAWLFLGNAYVKPLQAQQAFRSYLVGLNLLTDGHTSITKPLINPNDALGTIRQIMGGGYAPPYRGLP